MQKIVIGMGSTGWGVKAPNVYSPRYRASQWLNYSFNPPAWLRTVVGRNIGGGISDRERIVRLEREERRMAVRWRRVSVVVRFVGKRR